MALTIRFDCDAENVPALHALVLAAAQAPRVTGAHLCIGDADASAVRTAETRDRSDIQTPPNLFVIVDATDAEALANIVSNRELIGVGARGPFMRGVYRLEYVRTTTGFAP